MTLKDAGGSGSKIIEGSDQLIYPEGRNWEVSSIYTDCLSGSKSYGSTNVGNSRSSDDVGSDFIRYFDVYEIRITGNYIKLSFKVEVQNYGPAGSISMDIKGVDNNGFEIVSTLFYDKFSEDEYKALTKTKLIRLDDYERVSEWIIDSVDKY